MKEYSSFRDPVGYVIIKNNEVKRIINEEYVSQVNEFLASELYAKLQENGFMVKSYSDHNLNIPITSVPDSKEIYHEMIPFTVYPWEWCKSMLYDAGQLTISSQDLSVRHGFCLKDASVHNVLFNNGRPMLCDVLSFEKLNPSFTTKWIALAQFERHFILPFMAAYHTKIETNKWFYLDRDGVKPDFIAKVVPIWYYFLPRYISSVLIPYLSRQDKINRVTHLKDQDKMREPKLEFQKFFYLTITGRLYKKLNKCYKKLKSNSIWKNYDKLTHYSDDEKSLKINTVERIIKELNPAWVLDIGANCGSFSKVALDAGSSVVAIEQDHESLDALYQRFKGRKIFPLIANIANPSPSMGWDNRENVPLIKRLSERRFDLVMLLAVIHHLLITERVPLEKIVELLSKIACGYLVIEWVNPNDQMFMKLAGVNLHLYVYLMFDDFIEILKRYFTVEEVTVISDTRFLVLAKRL